MAVNPVMIVATTSRPNHQNTCHKPTAGEELATLVLVLIMVGLLIRMWWVTRNL